MYDMNIRKKPTAMIILSVHYTVKCILLWWLMLIYFNLLYIFLLNFILHEVTWVILWIVFVRNQMTCRLKTSWVDNKNYKRVALDGYFVKYACCNSYVYNWIEIITEINKTLYNLVFQHVKNFCFSDFKYLEVIKCIPWAYWRSLEQPRNVLH
jgi:hypothetical protein